MRRNSSKGCEDTTSRRRKGSASKAGRGSARWQVSVQVKQGKSVRQCRKGQAKQHRQGRAVVCYTHGPNIAEAPRDLSASQAASQETISATEAPKS